MKTLNHFLICLAAALFVAGCSNGSSSETPPVQAPKAPVLKTGTPQPLPAPAAAEGIVGTYYGYIPRADGSYVPLNVDLETKRSATGGPAELIFSLKVGLFGGVEVGSDNVNYDWTTGLLSASFSNGSDSTLEFIGHVKDDAIVDANVIGSRSGTQQVILSRKGADLFVSGEEARYSLRFPSSGSRTKKGDLVLTPQLQAQPSGSSSDLPLLPALSANFSFQWGASPVNVQKVVYDPLRAQMDLILDGGNRLHFEGVSISDDGGAFAPARLSGSLLASAAPAATVAAVLEAGNGNSPVADLETLFFTGTYVGSENYLSYQALGSLQYLGSQGHNPPEIAFPTFPNMQLSVTICLHGQGIGPMDFKAISMDPVHSKVLFEEDRSSEKIDYEAVFGPDFDSLKGQIVSSRSAGNSGVQSSALTLRVSGHQRPPACQ